MNVVLGAQNILSTIVGRIGIVNTTAGITYEYGGDSIKVYVDDVLKVTQPLGGNVLPGTPTTIQFGTRSGNYAADATFAAPE